MSDPGKKQGVAIKSAGITQALIFVAIVCGIPGIVIGCIASSLSKKGSSDVSIASPSVLDSPKPMLVSDQSLRDDYNQIEEGDDKTAVTGLINKLSNIKTDPEIMDDGKAMTIHYFDRDANELSVCLINNTVASVAYYPKEGLGDAVSKGMTEVERIKKEQQ